MKLNQAIFTLTIVLVLVHIIECRPHQRKGLRENEQHINAREDQNLIMENQDPIIAAKEKVEPQTVRRPKEIRDRMNLHKTRPKFSLEALNAFRRHRRSIDLSWRLLNSDLMAMAAPKLCQDDNTELFTQKQEYVKFGFLNGAAVPDFPSGCKTLIGGTERACGVEEIPDQPVEENSSVFVTKRRCADHLPRGLGGEDHVCQQEHIFVKIQDRVVKVESGCVPRLLDK